MSYPTKAERDAARKVLEQCAALGKTVLGDWREWSGVTLAVQTGQLSNSMEARMTLSAIDTCIDLLKRETINAVRWLARIASMSPPMIAPLIRPTAAPSTAPSAARAPPHADTHGTASNTPVGARRASGQRRRPRR